jgi:Asp-tRNA(Asn)/Glu-tRNA(Gln) amidotransferase A subunit family amidase
LDTSVRLQHRFALQSIVLQCMQEKRLDALTYPTANIPPPILNGPREPNVNGRSPVGWSLLGQQGFPALTVPAGFTTEVWDRVRDGAGTRLVSVKAKLPVGIDFMAKPFDEPTLFRIASAYEAATRHRTPPPDFKPLAGEP